ncbi:Grainyhead-like protein 1 homolog [Geodia barretti]|uniref:Grainyhead-like protein 1 homolog n=1 Tax=Geodia barretti TaxID=519541 RepID=A0AA35X4N6_GEOBA|nr:Grainyhead-like protein 1 homolog [Geodia barretti]
MSGKLIGSMRKNGVVNGSIHPSRDTSSSPIEVKQSSPSSLSQCSSQSCGSAGSAKSLPVTIPAQEQLSFPFTRQTSDPGLLGYSSPTEDNSPTQHRKGFSHNSLVPSSELPIMATEVVSVTTNHSGPGCSEISELLSSHPHTSGVLQHSRPLILQHPSHGSIDEGSNGSNYINWLCELYPSVLGSPSSKEKLSSYPETTSPLPPDSSHSPDPTHISSENYTQDHVDTVFSSQEKYVVTLGAPISIAQRMGEDTLTYLNKGQFYSLFCKANSGCPDLVKSVVYLTFFDEPDSRVEQSNWQYWYSQQANPNQRAFDIDRKACENIQGKPVDLAYNVASFIWRPKLGSKLVLRINCLSTEFSSQKGVKGYPLHMVVDTYGDLENEAAEPVHRAYCRVKIFRDKGAERKNKDETRNLDRRIQKIMRQRPGAPLDSDIPTSVFHPPTRETALTPTSTFGPKPFLFVPEQVRRPKHSFVPRKVSPVCVSRENGENGERVKSFSPPPADFARSCNKPSLVLSTFFTLRI